MSMVTREFCTLVLRVQILYRPLMESVTELNCPYCSIDFRRRTAEITRQRKQGATKFYCSSRCSGLAHRIPEILCKECGTSFSPRYLSRIFCSQTCAARHNNRLHPKRIKSIRPLCVQCGLNETTKNTVECCSTKCAYELQEARLISAWHSGELSGSTTRGELKRSIKNFLLKETSFKCSRCGWGESNPILGRPILTIEHIDGDWTNNSPTNVIVLCYNCHTLTPTFGTLNKVRIEKVRTRGLRRVLEDINMPV